MAKALVLAWRDALDIRAAPSGAATFRNRTPREIATQKNDKGVLIALGLVTITEIMQQNTCVRLCIDARVSVGLCALCR